MRRKKAALWVLVIALVLGLPFARWRWIMAVPTVPSDAVSRASLIMEIFPDTGNLRHYGSVIPAPEDQRAGLLLALTEYEPEVLLEAGRRFLKRPFEDHKIRPDEIGRAHVLYELTEIYWNGSISYSQFRLDADKGEIIETPSRNWTGMPPNFEPRWISRSGDRRNLGAFRKQRLSRADVDREILRALRDVPYKNGRWALGDPVENVGFLERLKRLVFLSDEISIL